MLDGGELQPHRTFELHCLVKTNVFFHAVESMGGEIQFFHYLHQGMKVPSKVAAAVHLLQGFSSLAMVSEQAALQKLTLAKMGDVSGKLHLQLPRKSYNM